MLWSTKERFRIALKTGTKVRVLRAPDSFHYSGSEINYSKPEIAAQYSGEAKGNPVSEDGKRHFGNSEERAGR